MDKLPITAHLDELRKTIVLSLSVVVVAACVCFYFSEDIFRQLTFPLRYTLGFTWDAPYISLVPSQFGDFELNVLRPAEALWTHIKIAIVGAIVITLPVIFYEIWKFVAPGLMKKEKKYILPFVFATTFLFMIGALFCFIIVLPFAVNFLLTYKMENLQINWTLGYYIDFCLKFILAFGIIFEVPVVLVFLTRMGIVTPDTLAKNRKYAIVMAFVAAALLTPTPDAFNQTLMALPIILLYEAGILASRILDRKKKDIGSEKAE